MERAPVLRNYEKRLSKSKALARIVAACKRVVTPTGMSDDVIDKKMRALGLVPGLHITDVAQLRASPLTRARPAAGPRYIIFHTGLEEPRQWLRTRWGRYGLIKKNGTRAALYLPEEFIYENESEGEDEGESESESESEGAVNFLQFGDRRGW